MLGLLGLACEAPRPHEAPFDAPPAVADAGGGVGDFEPASPPRLADADPPDLITADAHAIDAARPDAAAPPEGCIADVPEVPVRRLSPTHYRATVRALLDLPDAEPDLAPDPAPALSLLGAEKLAAAARQLAEAFHLEAVLPCDPADLGEEACLLAFTEGFADAALRRPPSEAERAWLLGVLAGLPPDATFEERVRLLVEVVLQSPPFLYRLEVGRGDTAVRPLTDHELATRLAYGFLDGPPAGALRAAADAGLLQDPVEITRQIEAVLATPQARARITRFLADWLELDRLDAVFKSEATWPEFTPALRAAMKRETTLLIEQAPSLEALLTDTSAWVEEPLAAVYGTAAGQVTLDAHQRAGVLTRAAFLSVRAGPDVQSAIHRGVFIRRHLLCLPMPPPPANVTDAPIVRGSHGDDGHPRTLREIVTARTAAPDCVGCHALINPIGFTLENFNAIGGFQTEESGYDRHRRQPYTVPVDARGTLPGSDIEGVVEGGVELSHALATSPQVADCLADQWFEWFFERPITPEDACSVEQLRAAFRASGGRFEALLRATPTLPAFRLIRVNP